MNIRSIYAVEIAGACNLEATCKWCPMHNRPRSRKRGLMTDATVARALHWVEKLHKVEALSLHVFGEPLLHPKFDAIAAEFAKRTFVTVSTNAVLLTEAWADRLAKIPWAWISVSPWDEAAQKRGVELLNARGIRTCKPPGVTHTWAGQINGPDVKIFKTCEFLDQGRAVIRWDGTIASCCITDREEDSLGDIFGETLPAMRGYSLCATCHHAR